MTPYKNHSGRSGVLAYEIGAGSIKVRFVDGIGYLYTRKRVGAAALATMQALATDGRGLSSFISREVAQKYTRKFDP